MNNEFENQIKIDFYYHVWCEEFNQSYMNSWSVSQLICNDMKHAAIKYAEKVKTSIPITIIVQDWRGRIAKFEIEVKSEPKYYARRIK